MFSDNAFAYFACVYYLNLMTLRKHWEELIGNLYQNVLPGMGVLGGPDRID